MLSEEKIKKMIRLSDYEKGQGAIDLKRVCYSKMDFVRYEIIKTVLAVFIATLLILMLCSIYYLNFLLKNVMTISFQQVGLYSIGGFLLIGLIGVGFTWKHASEEYEGAALRAKEYYKTLRELVELYEQEEQEANRI